MKIFKGKIMPVKAVLSLALALFAAASFVSCANDSGTDGNQDVKDTTAEKKALYAKISGTSWKTIYEDDIYKTILFSDTSIAINGTSYSIDLSKDLYFDTELSKKNNIPTGGDLYVYVNDSYLAIVLRPIKSRPEGEDLGVYYYYNGKEEASYYKLISSGSDSGGSESTSSVNGKYSYEATGSAISGAFTLSDGSWSYSGSKANISTNSGTYTVSGGKVTVKWTVTAGGNEIDNTETFSVTDNDDGTFTWKSEIESVSLWFNLLFNVSGLELTFTKSE